MSDSNPPADGYVPVPVAAAREISEKYSKDVVVVIAWDEAHNQVHKTTYGRGARHKAPAAALGEILAAAAGPDLTKKVDFEDFRHRAQAQWAEEREKLLHLLHRARDVLEMIPPPLSDCYTNGLQPDLYEVLGPIPGRITCHTIGCPKCHSTDGVDVLYGKLGNIQYTCRAVGCGHVWHWHP